MAKEDDSPDFGIENTIDNSPAGNTKLIDSLYETEEIDPDTVIPIEEEKEKVDVRRNN